MVGSTSIQLSGDFRDWLIAVSTAVAAVGTVGAVVYALYRDTIREVKRRPLLSMSLNPTWGKDNLDLVPVASPESHWIRARVMNAPGRHSAEDVEVLVARVTPLGKGAKYEAALDTRPLKWSNLGTFENPVTEVHLPPGVARYVDLLSVKPPLVSDGAGGARQAEPGESAVCMPDLEVHPKPSDQRHRLAPGHYRLELVVTARDVDAKVYLADIDFDGVWRRSPEFWQHLRVHIRPA